MKIYQMEVDSYYGTYKPNDKLLTWKEALEALQIMKSSGIYKTVRIIDTTIKEK